MTKAKARAKARAAAKAMRPGDAKSAKPEAKVRPGYFDAKSSTMRKFSGGGYNKATTGIKRGSARSR